MPQGIKMLTHYNKGNTPSPTSLKLQTTEETESSGGGAEPSIIASHAEKECGYCVHAIVGYEGKIHAGAMFELPGTSIRKWLLMH